MSAIINNVMQEMIRFDVGDPRRIHHFLKVYALAKSIGETEKLDDDTQITLEMAAILHDIGIHASEKTYGTASGRYQEIEGPPLARKLLQDLSVSADRIERVCFLIGHHHTYAAVDGLDYRILLEADFLVNIFEDSMSPAQIRSARKLAFRTETGLRYLETLYPYKETMP